MGLRRRRAGWSACPKALAIGLLGVLFLCFGCTKEKATLEPTIASRPEPVAIATVKPTQTQVPATRAKPTVTAEPASTVYADAPTRIVYVKHDATGNNDGSSWHDAYTRLQDALGAAQAGGGLWVAAGVYYPAPTELHRTATFELVDGVGLFGGFVGIEVHRDERDWAANLTILSGDLDRNDATDVGGVVTDTAGIVGRNAYRVVSADGVGESTVLDGFVITGGYGSSSGGGMYTSGSPTLTNVAFYGNRGESGGGMHNDRGRPTLTNVAFYGNRAEGRGGGMWSSGSPTLTNVTFYGNQAGEKGYVRLGGGGMYIWGGSPTLTNVTFGDNRAEVGGGMYNDGGSPTLTGVTFYGNRATEGGGMYNDRGSPTLTDVAFSGNEAVGLSGTVAVGRGGGMYNDGGSSPSLTNVTFNGNWAKEYGGGMYNYERGGRLTLTNVTFSENRAEKSGGGMHSYSSSGPVKGPSLTNVTFYGNQAADYGGGMSSYLCSPTLTNVTFYGNQASFGGGMSNVCGRSALTNVTFSGNRAEKSGGGMYNDDSSPALANCIVWGNAAPTGPQIHNGGNSDPVVVHSNVQGGYPGTGNIDADPLFIDPISADQAPTSAGDYRLREGSPVVDAGLNEAVTVDNDLDGNPRIVDGTGDGKALVDMGAYELQSR